MEHGTPLDAVIADEELRRRPGRRADRAGERAALDRLAAGLSGSPRHLLRQMSEVALALCRADSAGVSLLEQDHRGRAIFRWTAIAGQMANEVWGSVPLEESPSRIALERNAPVLAIRPQRHFARLVDVSPPIEEMLIVPFGAGGEVAGTAWLVSSNEKRRFDREDARLLSSLAAFASSGHARLSSLSADDVVTLARLNKARTVPAEPPAKSVPKRVLVVDDNHDAAQTLALLLRALGHQVEVAHNGSAGLRIARAMRPDIVLLDLTMPDMSGHDVGRQLRQSLGNSVRIVAVTGFGGDDDRQASLDAGFDQHLVKPVDPNLLRSLTG